MLLVVIIGGKDRPFLSNCKVGLAKYIFLVCIYYLPRLQEIYPQKHLSISSAFLKYFGGNTDADCQFPDFCVALQAMRLYLFNPDADMALADGGGTFIAPVAARRMEADLAALPWWYAASGDGVWAASAYNDVFFRRVSGLFGKEVRLVTEPEVSEYAHAQPMPWGWNASVRRRFHQARLPLSVLPTDDCLRRWRTLASRERVSACLETLSRIPCCGGESVNLYCEEDCRGYVESRGRTVLKAPWSGSGRGLLWCDGAYTSPVAGWCANVLRRQGCVVAAPVYDKVEDFALEFCSDGRGSVCFIGYSLFRTNAYGAYLGNLLLPDERFEERMEARYNVAKESLRSIGEAVRGVLKASFASYSGVLGIDMMVCRANNGFFIHPCVEINLRMNMGVVAGQLRRHVLAPGTEGYFRIEYHPSSEALRALHVRDEADAPLVVEERRIVSGYLPLVPVTPFSRYRAYLKVVPLGTARSHSHNGQWL